MGSFLWSWELLHQLQTAGAGKQATGGVSWVEVARCGLLLVGLIVSKYTMVPPGQVPCS